MVPPAVPRASIVIVTYGKREMTERCLASLDAALGARLGSEFELVLVDNDSPDDTLELLRRWEPRATVIALPENRNFSGGCNVGAAAARGDVLIFLNNDTVVGPDTFEPLAEAALEPGVGAVGVRLLFEDGTLQHGGVIWADNPNHDGQATAGHLLHRHDGELPAARASYELDVVTAACVAIPAAVFRQVGGFDEGYRNGYEDVDLCLRIRTAGFTIVYRGDLVVAHHEGATRAGQDDLPNVLRLLDRWGPLVDQDDELAAATWDVAIDMHYPVRDLAPASVVVVGDVVGFGPVADETRALLLAFAELAVPAAGFDLVTSYLRAHLSGRTAEVTTRALRRPLAASGLRIDVPQGASTAAASAADALMRDRASALRIPPAIDVPERVGPGGDGVLVALPSHDDAACRRTLATVASLSDQRVRLVPSVCGRGLAALVAELAPGAELLGPCSDEAEWTVLARTADVAICADPDDVFERRALTAAAAGATPVLLSADGPAGLVLGELALVAGQERADVPATREELAERVRSRCEPARVARELLASIGVVVSSPALSA